MIITTKQFLSSVWLFLAALVLTALFFALPARAQQEAGYASWTNLSRHGSKTASGERYDHKAMTAAHSSLPFDSMVRVTNKSTDESVVVRINDRTNGNSDHIINLSGAAARQLGLFGNGPQEVSLLLLSTENQLDIASLQTDEETKLVPNSERDTIAVQDIDREAEASSEMVSIDLPIRVYEQPTVPAPNVDLAQLEAEVIEGLYTLQIGSFSLLVGAEELAAQYEGTWIIKKELGSEVSYRVYFNKYQNEEPARSAQNRLWSEGQDSFLRKVRP